MKPCLACCLAALVPLPLAARAQNNLFYDQIAPSGTTYNTNSYLGLQQGGIVQSFTPTRQSVDYIQILLANFTPDYTPPGAFYINLRTGSFDGPVLASTFPVAGAWGPATFYFPASVHVTPGTTYYFEPRVRSGGLNWACNFGQYYYSRGNLFLGGVTPSWYSLWFREGVLLPQWPRFTIQPQSQLLSQGQDATLTGFATGGPMPTFQWQFNGANLSGATDPSFTITNVQPSDAGNYALVASNSFASVTSAVAVVTVLPNNEALLIPAGYSGSGQFLLSVIGYPGLPYILQTSTNLSTTNWVSLTTNPAPFTFVAWAETNYPMRFYRAVYRP